MNYEAVYRTAPATPGLLTMYKYILKHYFKPENKTDNSDFTKFGIKIGPVPDLQEIPMSYKLTDGQTNLIK